MTTAAAGAEDVAAPIAELAPVTIERGVCHLLFAYDVGFAVDLAECDRRITVAKHRAPLRPKRRAPSYFEYETPPLRVAHVTEPIAVGRYVIDPNAELTLFDFGAVSVRYRIPLEGSFEGLLDLSNDLYENERLLAYSRRAVEELLDVVRPAVSRMGLSDAVENYVVFEIQSYRPEIPLDQLRVSHAERMAQILRSTSQPLSPEEIADAHACRIAFGPKDCAIIDWNSALVFDAEPEEVRAVLEFANVELMEVRYLDEQLDDALDESYEVLERRKRAGRVFRSSSPADLHRVAQLQVDSAQLFEGINNALKLLGDQYLARVYRLVSQRFHLAEWDASILRKIQTLESIYQKMADRASSVRLEALEWVIIVLIAISIVLPMFGGK